MISPIQAFSAYPILPTARLRATAAVDNEELAKQLRARETANSRTLATPAQTSSLAYTVPVPRQETETPVADATIQGRKQRYARADTAETQGQSSSASSIADPFTFAASNAARSSVTLASVQPVRAQLDSASFVSLYASSDVFPVSTPEEQAARPYAQASQALANSFSFGEEFALNLAA